MNGFGQSTNGDANAGQPLTNGPVVEFEFKRNANSNNNNNNNSFEGASMNNKATSSDSGLNITNHRSQQQHHLESSGGISKSRFGSETDIISDTDSDSSSNASTVTLTPCTSDREDEDDTGHHWTSSELDLEESLAISSTLSSVADEVEQFSKAASNCLLTNGCFDPDFHNANTTTSSNINSSNNNNNNNSAPIPSVINAPSTPSSSTPQITASDCDAAPLPNGVA
ncbi:serine/threonine-protein kinase pakD-like [Symsagittifera roscoffensis]|uniref:serine/threonine-protein kinase pakD-like n=1 Tax=Symsagittifera roscoffensis TaxID=84072 RepID=UPI00307B4C6C